jgi:hypothetical protein
MHESLAMLDGEWKYGYRNWREKDVRARIYINAAMRHLAAWAEGQERADDSKVHHLGHARACLGILLDAQANGNLIDDRSKKPEAFEQELIRATAWVAWRRAYNRVKTMNKDSAWVNANLTEYCDAVRERDRLEVELEALEVELEALEV